MNFQYSTSPLVPTSSSTRRPSSLSSDISQHLIEGAAASPSSLGNKSNLLEFRSSDSFETRPLSLQRSGSHLSNSGRSVTHSGLQTRAQRSATTGVGQDILGTSPSFRGEAYTRSNYSPGTPGSFARTSGGSGSGAALPIRPGLTSHHHVSTPTPPIQEYREEEASHGVPVPVAPQSLKRYSSSFGQRRPSFNLGVASGGNGSTPSSLDRASILGAGSYSLRANSARGSSRPVSFLFGKFPCV